MPAKYWYGRIRGTLEPELDLLHLLVKPGDRAVDVGGNRGVYAYKLWKLGCRVEVFEPNPVCCGVLASWLRGRERVRLHPVALSSSEGQAELHIPVDAAGIEHDASASLEHEFDGFRNQTVSVRTLDSFGYEDAAFIKIDVEGHEQSVLAGAERTLETSAPALLVEVEQRHNKQPIDRIFAHIEGKGYRGYFLDPVKGGLRPLREFDPTSDQAPLQFGSTGARYINNFLFLHGRRRTQGYYAGLGGLDP